MLKYLGVKLIKFYQKHLSRGTCNFVPSCSEYTLEAILKHGFFVGCFLGAKRIMRCHPWTKGGFDRVPDKKRIVKWVY